MAALSQPATDVATQIATLGDDDKRNLVSTVVAANPVLFPTGDSGKIKL